MNTEIVESFAQMVREKGIDKDLLAGIVEDVFAMMVRKKYGQDVKFDVVVNMDKGDIEIFLEREVVETVENPVTQIDRETARELSGEELSVGEDYVEVVPLATFGRRLVVSAKQNLNQRIKEIEREIVYNEYSNTIGDIIVGKIYQIRRNEILINHNRNELVLPKSKQIPKERYKKGETIRAVVKAVRDELRRARVLVKLLLLLMGLLIGCAHTEMDMPKKTILKSTQKSKENWRSGVSVGRLAERASIDDFTVKIPTGDHASVKIGAMKSDVSKTIGESRTDQSGRFMFGARFTKRF